MNAQPAPRPRPAASVKPVIIGSLLTLLLFLSFASLLLDTRPIRSPATLPAGGEQIVYVAFGLKFDSVYTAPASDPDRRAKLFDVPHVDEYGIIASLSPDQRNIAYNALPASTRSPTPESPAELWVRPLVAGGQGILLAREVDLLVRPVWSGDSIQVAFRRSDARGYRLYIAGAQGEQAAVGTSDALFPVAFTPDGGSLYFVRISAGGSELRIVELAGGEDRSVALLSENLTREWVLSPAGDRLAYLSLALDEGRVASRAMILDLRTGEATTAGVVEADEFSPVWNGTSLSVGRLAGSRGVAWSADSVATPLPPPDRGFDVPQGWSSSGRALVVRTFEGNSAVAPGRSVLNLLTEDGARVRVASGEVTFLGWIAP
jgi:hypothetical protein